MADKPYSTVNHALYLTTYDDTTFSSKGEIDGDFLLLTYVNDTVTSTEGAKGDVQDSVRVASLGNVQLVALWGSDFNENMQQVFKDQTEGNFLKRAELKRISNTENVTVATSIDPKIIKVADYTLGTTAGDRTWNLKLSKLEFLERTAPA